MPHDPHDHGSHDPNQPHPPQPDHPEPSSDFEIMGLALNELLIEKGLYSADDLQRMIEKVEMANVETCGSKVVARAWADPDFMSWLLEDGYKAIDSLGIDPGFTEITALENSDEIHNVVVCTLCSCYPRWLLGRPPAWYKSKEYRARVVKEPRAVLKEFGTELSDETEVRVHDSNAELRYIVIPKRPEGSEGLSEVELAKLVTRDSMIGVSQALRPSKA